MSIPAWATPGRKVVCVGSPSGSVKRLPPVGITCPEVGTVYTIRRAETSGGEVGLYLDEIVNRPLPNGYEPGWLIHGFRPAVEPRTEAEDVAEFRKLLTQPIPEAV